MNLDDKPSPGYLALGADPVATRGYGRTVAIPPTPAPRYSDGAIARNRERHGTRRCPHCGKDVTAILTYCRACGRDSTPTAAA